VWREGDKKLALLKKKRGIAQSLKRAIKGHCESGNTEGRWEDEVGVTPQGTPAKGGKKRGGVGVWLICGGKNGFP